MRGASMRPLGLAVLRPQSRPTPYICRQCAGRRAIQISAAPATEFPKPGSGDVFSPARDESDARFEVLGSPYSLLSVSLSASQNLYTRRGTLVSVAGKVDNAQSTLCVLAPLRRALLGIPFLYQRIASTTPVTLLIATKAAHTTLFTLRLDGTTDWVVAQRSALLAWTGHTLAVTPQRGEGTARLGVAHWGTSFVTGRGLVALAAPGYIYPVTLAAGEELAVHPSHVVAYAVNKHAAPAPFRFQSAKGALAAAAEATTGALAAAASSAASTAHVATQAVRLRLQTPKASAAGGDAGVSTDDASDLGARLVRSWRAVQATAAYKLAARALFDARTVLRRTVWGDRLFVRVRGPTTLLLSSRGVRVAEALTRDDVNEIADTEPGVAAATAPHSAPAATAEADAAGPSTADSTAAIHVATVKPDGKVELAEAKDLNQFVR